MFSRILLAVDGSETARRATEAALGLAATSGATVDALHVVEDASPRLDGPASETDPARIGERILDDVVSEAEDVPVETHLVEERPPGTIVELADDRGVDLVVMGRSGRTGLSERLLGSTFERVIRTTDVPVLAIPAGSGPALLDYDDVLVTTDGSDAAELAAPYGADLARAYGGTLHLLTVVDVQREAGLFDAGGVTEAYVERLREAASGDVDALAAAAGDLADLEVRRSVGRGRPHEGIREYVEEHDVDLVVMSSQGQTSLAGQVLGSVTDRVLRVVQRPVLVVPA